MKKSMLGLTLALGVSQMGFAAPKSAIQGEYVPGEVLVKLKEGMVESFLAEKADLGIEVKENIQAVFGNLVLVKSTTNKSLNSLIADIQKNAGVEYAEPNFIYKAIGNVETIEGTLANARIQQEMYSSHLPNDPRFGELWGLKNSGNNEPTSNGRNTSPSGVAGADVNALAAWELSTGSKNITIAVIDTGVDYNHVDLANNMWVNEAELNGTAGVDDDGNGFVDDIHGYDFANNDGDPMDGQGHGTHCSGTIAAEHNNGIGVAGVMANAKIMAVKFLTDAGSGTTADAIKAINYATLMNVDLMSNSWGGGGRSQALEDAIKAAADAGIVFTAAAGNSASNNNTTPHYPSNYDVKNVISVAAHNYNDTLATFSCYGSRTVHVAAPGRNILSTVPGDAYAVYSGTSMATPHVSGVVGLYLAMNGRIDVEELRSKLMESSVYSSAYRRKMVSDGRVDAHKFLTGYVSPRPPKPAPEEWISTFDQTFASDHPYEDNTRITKTVTVPGARFLRVVVKKFDIESNYDYLKFSTESGAVVEKLDGQGENYVTDYVEGDTMVIEFSSDITVNKWGFEIEEVQYIP